MLGKSTSHPRKLGALLLKMEVKKCYYESLVRYQKVGSKNMNKVEIDGLPFSSLSVEEQEAWKCRLGRRKSL